MEEKLREDGYYWINYADCEGSEPFIGYYSNINKNNYPCGSIGFDDGLKEINVIVIAPVQHLQTPKTV